MSHPFDLVRAAVCREFTEWPTVSLTMPQACRYWGIEPTVCAPVLEDLVHEGFLVRRLDGRFSRAHSGRPPVQAKAPFDRGAPGPREEDLSVARISR
jgi:hypothetical protein